MMEKSCQQEPEAAGCVAAPSQKTDSGKYLHLAHFPFYSVQDIRMVLFLALFILIKTIPHRYSWMPDSQLILDPVKWTILTITPGEVLQHSVLNDSISHCKFYRTTFSVSSAYCQFCPLSGERVFHLGHWPSGMIQHWLV